jgi:hypothetical protein
MPATYNDRSQVGSTLLLFVRLATGFLIAATPGIVLLVSTSQLRYIGIAILGGFVGAGLVSPGVSARRVLGGFIRGLHLPFAHQIGERLMESREGDAASDSLPDVLVRGQKNPAAARRIVWGLRISLTSAIAFLITDFACFLWFGESWLVVRPPHPDATLNYAGAFLVITAYGMGVIGLTVRGSHWKPILGIGGFFGAVLFCVFFGAGGVVDAKCIGAGVIGGAFGLLIGSLVGWLMADCGCPADE